MKQDWIKTADKMPASGVTVLAYYKNQCANGLVIRANWVSEKIQESRPDSDLGDYDEATDTYYDPEGWYEEISNWDEYTSVYVYENITHWMPMPDAPKETA